MVRGTVVQSTPKATTLSAIISGNIQDPLAATQLLESKVVANNATSKIEVKHGHTIK